VEKQVSNLWLSSPLRFQRERHHESIFIAYISKSSKIIMGNYRISQH